MLVRGAEGVRLVPVDDGEPTVLSAEPGGAVPVGARVALSHGDELVLVEPDGGEVASVPFDADLGPVAVADAVVVPDGEGPSWRLLTEDGTVTELPELEGLVPGFGGRPERWIPFVQTDGQGGIGGRRVLAVDTRDGSVVTAVDLPEGQRLVGLPAVAGAGPGALVSVDDGSGTVAVLLDLDTGTADELGHGLQGAAFAPDGTRIVWSIGTDAELRVAPLDDLDAAQVLATGIALPLWLPA